jgi:hypothetical protein
MGHQFIPATLTSRKTVPALCALGCLLGGISNGAQADALVFKSTPASEAASQIERVFGATIKLQRGLNVHQPVTFTVDDIQQDGAVLDAINSFANAINADYRKELVVIPATGGAEHLPALDSADAPVVFKLRSLSAVDAVNTVAGVDQAEARMPQAISGTVKFSSENLTLREAVAEIAHQTHTDWSDVYVLTPHTDRGSSPGKVIGYTASGRPIIEMAGVTFRKPKPSSAPMMPDPPTDEDLHNPVYMSAFRRGDRTAMLKYQHHPNQPSDPAPASGGTSNSPTTGN